MTQEIEIRFALPINIDEISQAEIIIGYVNQSRKNSYDFVRTGKNAGVHIHMHKDKWVLFGSLLGARAHLETQITRHIARLDDIKEQWYKVVDGIIA